MTEQGWNRLELVRTIAELYTLFMQVLYLGVRLQGLCKAVVDLVAVYGRSLTGVATSSGS